MPELKSVLRVFNRLKKRMNPNTVTVSPKYQVVIPKDIRAVLSIHPGQKVQAIAIDNRIELIPLRSLKKARGFLAGIDTRVKRDMDRV